MEVLAGKLPSIFCEDPRAIACHHHILRRFEEMDRQTGGELAAMTSRQIDGAEGQDEGIVFERHLSSAFARKASGMAGVIVTSVAVTIGLGRRSNKQKCAQPYGDTTHWKPPFRQT